MDNKRLILGVLVMTAVVFGWQIFIEYQYRRHPEWMRPGQQTPAQQSATQPATQPQVAAAPAETGESNRAPTAGGMQIIATTQPARNVLLGADIDPRQVPLELAITSAGAAIERATLKGYRDHDGRGAYTFQTVQDPRWRALAVRTVVVNDVTYDIADAKWEVEEQSPRTATFSLAMAGPEGEPLLRIRRRYEIFDRSSPGQGFEVSVRHTFENRTNRPLRVKAFINGPAQLPRELDYGPDPRVVSGYDDGDQEIYVKQDFIEQFDVKKPTRDLVKSDKGYPLAWVGAGSVYFNAILRPAPLEAGATAKYLNNVRAEALNPSSAPEVRDVGITLDTNELPLAPGATVELPFNLFLGPKQRSLLEKPYYATFPLDYDSTLVVAGACGICTFQWVISLLVTLLSFFHWVLRDWGLAIIALVCLVRLILHPITKRSQIRMARMGKMQPEIERLKKKYGDDKEALNKEMAKLQMQNLPDMMLGCLPMLLQMPIWIGLYSALNSTFELRQAPFLEFFGIHLTWIDDLARPDRLITWTPIRLPLGIHLSALNLLPILMGGVFWLQQKYTPKPPAQTPEQEQQQKMMQWMTLLFPLFLYNGPSGLNLYILTSTTIGIIESRRIRRHIKEREAAEKAGPILVDAKPTRGSRTRKDGSDEPPAPKRGGIVGWLIEMQEKAEQMRREAERGKGR